MKEQLVSFETAVLAKEKGFHCVPNIEYYNRLGKLCHMQIYSIAWHDLNHKRGDDIIAPTQSLLQKWLREKHDIYIKIGTGIYPESKNRYYEVTICLYHWMHVGTLYITYEEALEEGLKRALLLIK